MTRKPTVCRRALGFHVTQLFVKKNTNKAKAWNALKSLTATYDSTSGSFWKSMRPLNIAARFLLLDSCLKILMLASNKRIRWPQKNKVPMKVLTVGTSPGGNLSTIAAARAIYLTLPAWATSKDRGRPKAHDGRNEAWKTMVTTERLVCIYSCVQLKLCGELQGNGEGGRCPWLQTGWRRAAKYGKKTAAQKSWILECMPTSRTYNKMSMFAAMLSRARGVRSTWNSRI